MDNFRVRVRIDIVNEYDQPVNYKGYVQDPAIITELLVSNHQEISQAVVSLNGIYKIVRAIKELRGYINV